MHNRESMSKNIRIRKRYLRQGVAAYKDYLNNKSMCADAEAAKTFAEEGNFEGIMQIAEGLSPGQLGPEDIAWIMTEAAEALKDVSEDFSKKLLAIKNIAEKTKDSTDP